MAVRSALLDSAAARKRVLVLLLHDKVRSEALAIRGEVNATTLHATHGEGFSSPAWDRLREKRTAVDPFGDQHQTEDVEAYRKLSEFSDTQMNALIAVLIVESVTALPMRKLDLIQELAIELKVDLRECWRPDAEWLSSYQKIQLSHLMGELKGPIYRPDDERRKKSEMVEALASIFTEAAAGTIDDAKLAERANRWMPSNMITPSAAPG